MTRQRHRGFTLIELIIFIVVTAVGLSGILAVSNNVIRSSADPLVRKQALAVAQSLLEEILQKAYAKPAGSTVAGFPTGARSLFDTVADYNNYTTTAGIVDAGGASVAGLGAYNIAPKVVVSSVSLPGSAQQLLRVEVSVTGPQGVVTLIGYRGAY